MPPSLAFTLSLMFSAVFLWREQRQHPEVSWAAWVPCIWLLILGSRPVSGWLGLSGPSGMDAMMEGSPFDRGVYLVLIIAAVLVVVSRRPRWQQVFSNNRMLVCFFAYCAVSVLWSDFPSIALKRWFKSLGDPLMALILVTEVSPAVALSSVLRRCAIVLLPMSIVFIKYFPYLGRGYDAWSGLATYTGVTTNKNMLGYLLLVFGLLYLSTLFTRGIWADKKRRSDVAVALLFLGMIAWLFKMADSKTPLVAMCFASLVVAALGSATLRKFFGPVALLCLVSVGVLEGLLNLHQTVIESAGRDATLTGRTEIWTAVLSLAANPFLGAGFQSFWLGDRLTRMWALFPVFKPNQAHSGYIEIYLNLGWIGLGMFVGVLIGVYRSIREKLQWAVTLGSGRVDDLVLAKFAMGYFLAYLLYNVTEAIFQPLNFLFIVFLVLGIRYRTQEQSDAARPALRPAARDFRAAVAAAPAPLQWRGPNRQPETLRRPWAGATRHETAGQEPHETTMVGPRPNGTAAWSSRPRSPWSAPAPKRGSDKSSR